jgi:hypothetical protein
VISVLLRCFSLVLAFGECIVPHVWAGDSWHSSKIIRADEKKQESSR